MLALLSPHFDLLRSLSSLSRIRIRIRIRILIDLPSSTIVAQLAHRPDANGSTA